MEYGYIKEEVGKRIKKLRTERGWSIAIMGKELNSLIGYEALNVMKLDGDTGKYTVSQLENAKRSLTVDLAMAYAHIFDVSLDYIYCRTDDWKPENFEAKTSFGFSDKTIAELKKYKKHSENNEIYFHSDGDSVAIADYSGYTETLNRLIENEDECSVLSCISQFLLGGFDSLTPTNKRTGHKVFISGADFDAINLLNLQSQLKELKKVIRAKRTALES